MITAIIVLYIAYCCCIKLRARRKEEKERSRERRRIFIRREMENRSKPGEGKQSLAIEMGSQNSGEPDRLYIPRYHNTERDTANKGTQDSVTFE